MLALALFGALAGGARAAGGADVTIDSAPPALSASASASFSFSSTDSTATFECALDGAAAADCESPVAYDGLADGDHAFAVTATGGATATAEWTVDTTAPETTIDSAQTDGTDASFAFSSDDADATFRCSLDGADDAACTSPASYTGLAAGSHTFSVAAVDAAGNADASPAVSTWTVDAAEPQAPAAGAPDTSIADAPSGTTAATGATISFTSTDPGAAFRCALDSAPLADCTSPVTLSGLADGEHTFQVVASDAFGTDATPATATWTVDTTPPQTTISQQPPAATNQTTATFAFASSEPGSTFACSLDGGAATACTSPVTSTGLTAGAHTFAVAAADALENADATPATASFTVDLTAPDTTIVTGPAATITVTTATFTFSSPDATATFQCSLDGAAFAACTTPRTLTGLAQGSHTFRVQAVDPAGNADATAAASTFRVATPPPTVAPTGATGIALDGRVELAWQPSAGAAFYDVYRGTSPGAITDLVSPTDGVTGTTFTDTTAANGQTYYYAIRGATSGGDGPAARTVQARPVARGCSSGNPVVLENCYAGDSGWRVQSSLGPASGGIEGFATASSIDRGGSVDLKVNGAAGATFHVEVYRSGWYGGAGARLFSTILGIPGVSQPACTSQATTTGLYDCSNWSVTATLTTTASWPSGVYLLRLVRDDDGEDAHVLLVVRDDSRSSDLLYGVPFSTYQAYNNYGGKSLYGFNSSGATTVANGFQAVKVSFDRPYEQAKAGGLHDWYTRSDFSLVSWLERSGYDVAYQAGTDMERSGVRLLGHKAYVLGTHDEYYSSGMRSALENARDNGVSLLDSGANAVYWRIRYENGPNGGQDRVEVCYKTTQTNVVDPSGPTGTWRDPAGANRPENALLGIMYIGDNSSQSFPLQVPAAAGADRVYRYTGLDSQAAGATATVGSTLVGWEWDARVQNGFEPAGVKTLSASAVNGNLIQNDGAGYITGPSTSNGAKYVAASGALVFATGTNQWARGLAPNAEGTGDVDVRIQQEATNVLADMGVQPQTPVAGVRLDGSGPRVTALSPGDMATGVAAGATVRATFSGALDPATVTASSFTLKRPDGSAVAATVAYDAATTTATLTPSAPLASSTTYTARLETSIKASDGTPLGFPVTWSFTTAATAASVRINAGGGAYTTADGRAFGADASFTGGNVNTSGRAIAGTNDAALYQNERWGQFSYAIPVANGTYDVKFHFVELYYGTIQPGGIGKRVFSMDVGDTPASPDLANIDVYRDVGANAADVKTVYGVTITDGILNIASVYGAADDPEVAAIEITPSTGPPPPPPPPTVTTTAPAAGDTGVPTGTKVAATFSRAMDGSTLTGSSFTLAKPDGTTVAATVAYDSTTTTATLTPSAALATATTYTAKLDTVKAGDGAALASPFTWTFTTAAAGTSVRINAGGGAYTTATGAAYTADASFTGGSTYTSNAVITGTSDPALYRNERWGQFSYAIPVPNGTYDVKLHFVELYYGSAVAGGVGKRVFSIDVDDTPASPDVSGIDIYKDVGPNAADDKTVTGVQVSDGVLNLRSVYGAADDPEVAAIEVVPSGAPPPPPGPPTVTATTPAAGATLVATTAKPTARFSRAMDPATITAASFTLKAGATAVAATVAYDAATQTATLTPSAKLQGTTAYTATVTTAAKATDGTPLAAPFTWSFTTGSSAGSVVHVNSGGGAFTTAGGVAYTADANFTGGNVLTTPKGVAGTIDPALYQNERWGQFSYSIPVEDGTYDVTFHFAELYYAAPCAGKRIFSMDVDDTPASPDLANIDICAAVGAASAYDRTVKNVSVGDGFLDVHSVYGTVDDPEVTAIDVVPSGSAPAPPDPKVAGQWSPVEPWPLTAVHMSLLPTGNVLAFDAWDDAPNTQRIWNPLTDAFTPVPYGRNIFCAGHILLPDGRTLIVGGNVDADLGLADTTMFDAVTNTWTRGPDMSVTRWYPTATQLPDGRVLVFAGDNIVQNRTGAPPPLSDASVDSLPSIYDPVANRWTDLTGSKLTSPLYPFMFVLSNGKVLDAGPDLTTRTLDPATGAWATVATAPFDGMSAVMYRPDKIMKAGAWADPDFRDSQVYASHARTAVLDMTQPSPAWRETAPMANPRAYQNLTLLPDGTVLATGGMTTSDGTDVTKGVLPAELWNPDTETWTTMASEQVPREYHSTALLLPDGRVLMAGGGELPQVGATNQRNAEIYSPPYLFKGARPTISSAPSLVQYGSTFTVSTPDAASIRSVSLIRTPSVTHAFDENQRFQRLSFTTGSGSLAVTAPANARLAPPGYYMLFVVDDKGVPSVASFVRFPTPAEDVQPPTAPAGLSATGGAGQVALSWSAATDDVGVVRYDVYRGTSPGFTPGVANRIAQPVGTSYTDTGLAGGTYYYAVKAEDAAGNLSAASNEASAAATGDATAPTVSVTAPAAGATVTGTVSVTASAADDVGVAGVQFRLDGASLGAEDTTAPYSVSWSTTGATNGPHTLTAVARDAAGNATTSAGVAVTVSNTAPPPGAGPVAAYSFNQGSGTSVADASGNGNNGVAANATWTTAGKFGGALSFNGTSTWVTVPDSLSLHLGTGMTLEAWVKPSALGTGKWRNVVFKEKPGGMVYALYASNGASRPIGQVDQGGVEQDAIGTAAVSTTAWTHLALTYDGTTLRLYVNGTQVTAKTVGGAITSSTGVLRMGGNSVWPEWFAGQIDEVRIYDRPLAASEIAADMTAPITP